MSTDLGQFSDKLIAIVDDNRVFISQLKAILFGFGLRNVVDFTDPAEVQPFLETRHVSLLFLDLMMPKINGFQLAHQLRHAPDLRNRVMPVIMTTAQTGARNLQMAINVGIDELLLKPVRPAEVRARIVSAMTPLRVYIKARSGYFGPERRRRQDVNYKGLERRVAASSDTGEDIPGGETPPPRPKGASRARYFID